MENFLNNQVRKMVIPRKKVLMLKKADKTEVGARSLTTKERFNIILVRNLVTIPMNGGTMIQTRKVVRSI